MNGKSTIWQFNDGLVTECESQTRSCFLVGAQTAWATLKPHSLDSELCVILRVHWLFTLTPMVFSSAFVRWALML